MSKSSPVSVVETPEFLAAARRIMDEEERGLLVDYLAHNPMAGDLIPGTGGVRKLRWALEERGKMLGKNSTVPVIRRVFSALRCSRTLSTLRSGAQKHPPGGAKRRL